MKLRILKWRDNPDYPGPRGNHKCLYNREAEGELTQTQKEKAM